jgi:membrane-bound lytic murein transglycosylase D
MLKKFLAGVFSLFLFSFSYANEGDFDIQTPFSDTTDKQDSLLEQIEVSDPKQGFKDLFISSASADRINTGQLHPMAVSFVEDYIGKFGKKLEAMKGWGKPYFDVMDAILVKHGLPKELKYLAVAESELKTQTSSWAGAAGPWQFMPATARNMGLKVNSKYDERKDFSKSTHAASRYLTNLFSIYGDWLLVIAAYNGGPGKVNVAIKKSGSRDFWKLQKYLPAESKNHVKKFIAIHYMMEGQGSIATATKEEAKNLLINASLTQEESNNSRIQSISGRYNSLVIVKHITMDIAAFNKMNPDFDKLIAFSGNYELRLPGDKMEIFLARKPEILNESIQLLLNPNGSLTETSSR